MRFVYKIKKQYLLRSHDSVLELTNLSEGHVHWLDTHSASPYKHSEALLQVPLAPSSERKHLYKYEYSTLNCSAFSEISSKPKSSVQHDHI